MLDTGVHHLHGLWRSMDSTTIHSFRDGWSTTSHPSQDTVRWKDEERREKREDRRRGLGTSHAEKCSSRPGRSPETFGARRLSDGAVVACHMSCFLINPVTPSLEFNSHHQVPGRQHRSSIRILETTSIVALTDS